MLAAVRELRRGRLRADDLRDRLADLADTEARREPGRPGVERILPVGWFDAAWVQVERRWPSGRLRPRPPRWAGYAAGALLLIAAGGAGAAYVVTAEVTTEVVGEIVAEPVEDPEALVVPGPQVSAEPEEVPELFGDVELGQLPGYDLSGTDDDPSSPAPTVGPPDAPTQEEDAAPDGPGDEVAEAGAEDRTDDPAADG